MRERSSHSSQETWPGDRRFPCTHAAVGPHLRFHFPRFPLPARGRPQSRNKVENPAASALTACCSEHREEPRPVPSCAPRMRAHPHCRHRPPARHCGAPLAIGGRQPTLRFMTVRCHCRSTSVSVVLAKLLQRIKLHHRNVSTGQNTGFGTFCGFR